MDRIAARKRRASALIMVMAMMFVLMILVTGMHWRESTARASQMREEANLEARVAAEYELAKQVHPEFTFNPEKQTVRAALAANMAIDFPRGLARPLFEDKGLVNMVKVQAMPRDPKLLGRPGKAWNLVSPTSSDPGMQPDKIKMLGVIANDFPYVACAPAGNITAKAVQPWSNELFKLGYSTESAMNGAPAKMAALGNIEVGNLTHGELYLTNGTCSVDQGRFIAYAGPPADLDAPEAYPKTIGTQVQGAIDKLAGACQDKTNLVNGNILSLDTIIDLFTGKADSFLGKALSMRQAMQFPFFLIPGGKVQGIIVTVWLHMPFPPDGAGAKGKLDELEEQQTAKSKGKQDELSKQHAEVETLTTEVNSETDPQKKKLKQSALASAKSKEEQIGGELKDLQQEFAGELKDVLDKIPDEETNGPATREDDEKITGENGVPYMSYKKFYQVLLQFCADVVVAVVEGIGSGKQPDMSKFMHVLYKEVRLVHFGSKSNETAFTITDTDAEMKATFDVPAGRAVKLRTNLKINGDLWLMRGSTFVVEGNLVVASPLDDFSADPRKPRGRVFLEEGAKLIVKGNFSCEGSEALGSILIGAPINAIHPTTSAIMCTGNITIPHGVWPAFSLGDLDLDEIPQLKTFRDIITTVVPNIAKLAGPFHRRKPFFSQYATMFVIASVLTPIGPIPIPIPLPAATNANVNVKLFKAMALIYGTQMNLAWGENFITHTDWWLIGQGMVPLFPKINPTVYLDKIKNFNFHIPEFPSAENIQKLVQDQGPKLVKEMAPKLITEVIVKIVISQLSFGFADALDNVGAFDLLQKSLDDVFGVETSQKSIAEIAGLDALMDEIKGKIFGQAALMMLQETPGVLIYSGGRIAIAEGPSAPAAPVTIGFLVAQDDVVSNATYTVGAVMSLKGNIKVNTLLSDPNSTRCSLFFPQVTPTEVIPGLEWFNWAVEYRYGHLLDVGEPVDVGPQYRYPSIQGWHE